MARTRFKAKGRRESGTFIALPHVVINSHNWLKLSPHAVKLFIDLYAQFKGTNNGDLCAAWSMMKPRGWKSKATLTKALTELQHYGMITLTRQGGRKIPNLYGVTFQSIDECKGKLDVRAAPPSSEWRTPVTTPAPKSSGRGGWGHRKKLDPLYRSAVLPATPPVSLGGPVVIH